MPSSKTELRLADIAANAGFIQSYVSGMDRDEFVADRKTVDAVERCLMRIAEAVIKLGSWLEDEYPAYPWRNVRGFGNFVRHQYDLVNPGDIWSIVQVDLPEMQRAVTTLRSKLAGDSRRGGLPLA